MNWSTRDNLAAVFKTNKGKVYLLALPQSYTCMLHEINNNQETDVLETLCNISDSYWIELEENKIYEDKVVNRY